MTFLLDVNVLIALIDTRHLAHDEAHAWFDRDGARDWATCPMTENGVVRICGQRTYPNSPGPPSVIADVVARFCQLPGHSFWSDDVSILNANLVDRSKIVTSRQVADIYLLALAARHGGQLATFDRRLSAAAVKNGHDALHSYWQRPRLILRD